MTCYLSVGTRAFADNPILLDVMGAAQATYKVFCNGYQVYEGIASDSFTANLSELLRGRFTSRGGFINSGGTWPYLKSPALQTDYTLSCLVTVADTDGSTWSRSFTAFRGGIPKRLFRAMADEGTTFIDEKDKTNANSFFSIRSNGWRISVKETELLDPLMILLPSAGTGTAFIRSLDGTLELELSGTPGKIYGLDLRAIRTYFIDEYDTVCNVFKLYNQTGSDSVALACTITIEQAEAAPERHLVRFRNSLGMMETVELVGKASMTAEPTTANGGEESTVTLQYDAQTDSYTEVREKISMVETISIPSGPKRIPEILMLRDMLCSDEVYLVVEGEEWRVLPSCEELAFPLNPTEPQSFDIALRMTEGDECTGFCFINGDFVKPRIFTEQFTDQFS